jgi:hypothetical protein
MPDANDDALKAARQTLGHVPPIGSAKGCICADCEAVAECIRDERQESEDAAVQRCVEIVGTWGHLANEIRRAFPRAFEEPSAS